MYSVNIIKPHPCCLPCEKSRQKEPFIIIRKG